MNMSLLETDLMARIAQLLLTQSVTKMSLDRGGERSPSYSPVITRKGIADTPFSIPRGYKLTKGDNLANSLDLSQYRAKTLQRADSLSVEGRGELTFSLSYSESTERLRVDITTIADVALPDPIVTGSRWSFIPSYHIVLLPEKKRLTREKPRNEKSSKCRYEITLKRNDLAGKTLRISVQDKNLQNASLPVGHVLVNLNDVKIFNDTVNLTRTLSSYSVPAGFNKGQLKLSASWIASAQKLEIKIGKAQKLKSPRGILGREFFVRLVVFVGGEAIRTQKSASAKATPVVDFNEKLFVPLTTAQLLRCSLVFTLFAKNIVKLTSTSEEIGTARIGPYMATNQSTGLTQWEQLVTTPFEELTELHTLYL